MVLIFAALLASVAAAGSYDCYFHVDGRTVNLTALNAAQGESVAKTKLLQNKNGTLFASPCKPLHIDPDHHADGTCGPDSSLCWCDGSKQASVNCTGVGSNSTRNATLRAGSLVQFYRGANCSTVVEDDRWLHRMDDFTDDYWLKEYWGNGSHSTNLTWSSEVRFECDSTRAGYDRGWAEWCNGKGINMTSCSICARWHSVFVCDALMNPWESFLVGADRHKVIAKWPRAGTSDATFFVQIIDQFGSPYSLQSESVSDVISLASNCSQEVMTVSMDPAPSPLALGRYKGNLDIANQPFGWEGASCQVNISLQVSQELDGWRPIGALQVHIRPNPFSPSKNNNGLTPADLAGIVLGSVALLLLVILFVMGIQRGWLRRCATCMRLTYRPRPPMHTERPHWLLTEDGRYVPLETGGGKRPPKGSDAGLADSNSFVGYGLR